MRLDFGKPGQNATLGQLHFLGSANGHTYTLSVHCCNTKFS